MRVLGGVVACLSAVAALPNPQQQIVLDPAAAAFFQQPDSSDPVDWPYRALPWGEVNFIATTDTHGWLLGHQRHEPSFSGDWGDFYSFTHRLKQRARTLGVDLLLVDAGDRVDGNGLVDAEPRPPLPLPDGATSALDLFSHVPYDVVTTGNHELYKYEVAERVGRVLNERFGDRFVVSNVNITSSSGTGTDRPYGNRVRKFETEQGRKVTAFGPLFDFKAHAKGTIVQPPAAMVRQDWFLKAIAARPDFFLFVGHMSVDIEPDSEWRKVIAAVRAVHPKVPIVVFGGHHHVRQCARYDDYSMGLAGGRYMETIGFMSLSGLNETEDRAPTFRRRYLDQNRNTYAYHAGGKDFDTPTGLALTRQLRTTAKLYNLTDVFGHAPRDFYLYRYPHTSPHSVLNLMTSEVLPKMVRRTGRGYEPYVVLNTGSIRFDIFKGPFTRNDQWIILPFTNAFLYVPAVARSLASKLLRYLNLVGEHGLSAAAASSSQEGDAASSSLSSLEGEIARAADAARLEHAYRRSILRATSISSSDDGTNPSEESVTPDSDSQSDDELARRPRRRPTKGYVTLDPPGCGGDDDDDDANADDERFGDDTLHRPFKSSWQPIFVATDFPPPPPPPPSSTSSAGNEEEDCVDVVFLDFIKPDILSALNVLSAAAAAKHGERAAAAAGGGGGPWTEEDVEVYLEGITANTLMEEYAKRYWQQQ
ncbi:hypothetical protein B0A53_03317 [Rhodotorula sp. CCFEE 5036]|nr:hypothetical protein B0A53_03317 [Rhodotorula sp. CCFEE 5036]